MPHRLSRVYYRVVLAAATLVLAFAAGNAQAAIAVTANDASFQPGGPGVVQFNLDFGAGTSISSFDYHVSYDPNLLTLTDAPTLLAINGVPLAVTADYGGLPYDPATELPSRGTYSQSTTAQGDGTQSFDASWFALDSGLNQTPPLTVSGPATLNLNFLLASTFPVGASTLVNFTLNWSDENIEPFGPIAATANVTAVPLPASFLLLLSGLGAVAGWARRRSPARA